MLKPASRLELAVRHTRQVLQAARLFDGALVTAATALLVSGCASKEVPGSTERHSIDRRAQPLSAMDTVKLAAARDTSVRSAFPNQNFGTDFDLEINRALVAFDQGALGAALGPQDYVEIGRAHV